MHERSDECAAALVARQRADDAHNGQLVVHVLHGELGGPALLDKAHAGLDARRNVRESLSLLETDVEEVVVRVVACSWPLLNVDAS